MLGKGLISKTGGESVKMHVTVEGLGPRFKLVVRLTNEGMNSIVGAKLSLSYNPEFYKMESPIPNIGALLPFATLPLEIFIENIDANGGTDPIRIYVIKRESQKPMAGTVVQMPISEFDEFK